jgi:hypothetical protein
VSYVLNLTLLSTYFPSLNLLNLLNHGLNVLFSVLFDPHSVPILILNPPVGHPSGVDPSEVPEEDIVAEVGGEVGEGVGRRVEQPGHRGVQDAMLEVEDAGGGGVRDTVQGEQVTVIGVDCVGGVGVATTSD